MPVFYLFIFSPPRPCQKPHPSERSIRLIYALNPDTQPMAAMLGDNFLTDLHSNLDCLVSDAGLQAASYGCQGVHSSQQDLHYSMLDVLIGLTRHRFHGFVSLAAISAPRSICFASLGLRPILALTRVICASHVIYRSYPSAVLCFLTSEAL